MNFFQRAYNEYSLLEGQNSGQLTAYMKSPEAAIRQAEAQYRNDFEIGHALEAILFDKTRQTDTFSQAYFVADLKQPPDDLIKWVLTGENWSSRYVRNKDGSLNKTYATRHEWLDRCALNPGKIPLALEDHRMLLRMSENILKIELDLPGFGILTVREMLKHPCANWQQAKQWNMAGIRKKALADVCFKPGNNVYLFDFKSTASLSKFESDLNSSGWVQDLHYGEGFGAYYPMIFLVAEKTEDALARPFDIDIESRERLRGVYERLCREYAEWVSQGKPVRGWLPKKTIRIFVRNEDHE